MSRWGFLVGAWLYVCTRATATLVQVAAVVPSDDAHSVDWSVSNKYLAAGMYLSAVDELQIFRFLTNSLALTNSYALSGLRSGLSVSWHPQDPLVALGAEADSFGPELGIFHLASNSAAYRVTNWLETGGSVTAAEWLSGTNHYLLAGTDNSSAEVQIFRYAPATTNFTTVTVYDASSNRRVATNGIRSNLSGNRFAVAFPDANADNLQILSFNGTSLSDAGKLTDNNNYPTAVSWSPGGDRLAVGFRSVASVTRSFAIYNYSGSALTLRTNIHFSATHMANSVDWMPSNSLVAVGYSVGPGSSGRLRVFQYQQSTETLRLMYSNHVTLPVTSVRWSRDGRYLAVADQANFITIYETLRADLALTKTGAPALAQGGDALTYTLLVTNRGPTNAVGVVLTDFLPTNVTFNAASPSQGTCSQAAGVVYCNLGAISNGGWATVQVLVTVDAPLNASFTNSANVWSDIFDHVSSNDAVAYVTGADGDGDGVRNEIDNCPAIANPGQENADGDAYGNACDKCPNVNSANQADSDGDGVGNVCDNCISNANPDQINSDGDGYGDACDNCPTNNSANLADTDGDGKGDICDGCPDQPDSGVDSDLDGIDNACDPDKDGDGLPNDWEESYELPSLDPSNAELDPDGDGYPTWEEYLFGTVPVSNASHFAFLPATNDARPVIAFVTATGRWYDIQISSNLPGATWVIWKTNLPGQPGGVSILETNTSPERHFRVRAKIPP